MSFFHNDRFLFFLWEGFVNFCSVLVVVECDEKNSVMTRTAASADKKKAAPRKRTISKSLTTATAIARPVVVVNHSAETISPPNHGRVVFIEHCKSW
jgi:hypothetical protein